MALANNSSAGNDVLNGSAITFTLPGTPQAGDWYGLVAVAYDPGATSADEIEQTAGPTFTIRSQFQFFSEEKWAWGGTRAWQSGDGTSVTLTVQTTGGTPVSVKYIAFYCILIRPGTGEEVLFLGNGSGGSAGTTTATDNTFGMGSAVTADDLAMVVALVNSKQTAFSNWQFGDGTGTWTEEFEDSLGSGAPSNWASFAAAYITGTSSGSEVQGEFDVDDTGEDWAASALSFEPGLLEQTLTGALFSKAPTFPQGKANFRLIGVLFTKGPTFPVGAVVPGYTITGILFTKAPTFPTGTVQVDQTITGVLYALAPTFPTGSVTSGAFIGWGIPIA
jgi:hypothetical protein